MSTGTPGMTIVVCTYNRAQRLRGMLASLERSMPAGETRADVLIVDNASTDETPDVIREFTRRLPLRSVLEPVQGLSAARNRAVRETRAETLWFLDDDVIVGRDWFARVLAATRERPEADWFGGRVLPVWERRPPGWLMQHGRCPYQGMLVWYDPGETDRVWTPDMPLFFGANIGFRRRVFDTGHRFDEDLGRIGNRARLGEEAQIQNRLAAEGRTGWYVAGAVVHHPVPAQRMTLRYLAGWHVESGKASAAMACRSTDAVRLAGVPRYLYRQALSNLAAGMRWWAQGLVTLNGARRARGLADLCRGWGKLCGISRESLREWRPKRGDSTTSRAAAAAPAGEGAGR